MAEEDNFFGVECGAVESDGLPGSVEALFDSEADPQDATMEEPEYETGRTIALEEGEGDCVICTCNFEDRPIIIDYCAG